MFTADTTRVDFQEDAGPEARALDLSSTVENVQTRGVVDTGSLITAGGGSSGNSDSAAAVQNGALHGGLFGIARSGSLRIQVQVPQTDALAVRPGQKAYVTDPLSAASTR